MFLMPVIFTNELFCNFWSTQKIQKLINQKLINQIRAAGAGGVSAHGVAVRRTM